jgi:hypothetical protein
MNHQPPFIRRVNFNPDFRLERYSAEELTGDFINNLKYLKLKYLKSPTIEELLLYKAHKTMSIQKSPSF